MGYYTYSCWGQESGSSYFAMLRSWWPICMQQLGGRKVSWWMPPIHMWMTCWHTTDCCPGLKLTSGDLRHGVGQHYDFELGQLILSLNEYHDLSRKSAHYNPISICQITCSCVCGGGVGGWGVWCIFWKDTVWYWVILCNSLSPARFEEIWGIRKFSVYFSDWWMRYPLWNCPEMNVAGP